MSNKLVHIVFHAMALVAAASLQCTLPTVLGAKLPLAAALVFETAMTSRMLGALALAVAAGGMCDALSGLPGLCTSGYLLIVSAVTGLMRGSDRSRRRPCRTLAPCERGPRALEAAVPFAFVAAGLELWTRAWLSRLDGGACAAAFGAAFTGFFVEYAVFRGVEAVRPLIGMFPCTPEEEAS